MLNNKKYHQFYILFIVSIFLVFFHQPAFAKSQTHATRGMLIGAGSGMAVGLATTLLVSQSLNCNNNRSETCLSSSTQAMIITGGTLGMVAIGTGVGALIGKMIPKKQNISIAPSVIYDHKSKIMGGALHLSKQF